MAGISFLRDRSPVTPKITRPHGPATRGSRLSAGSRRGLDQPRPPAPFMAVLIVLLDRHSRSGTPAAAGGASQLLDGLGQGHQSGDAVDQVQAQHPGAARGQRGGVRRRDRSLQLIELLVVLTGPLDRVAARPGELADAYPVGAFPVVLA